MRYAIRIRSAARKELERIPQPDRKRIADAIERLAENPLTGRALTGVFRGLWRLRVGSWRILYEVRDDALVVLVVRVAHRRNVYRRRAR